ncbi:MAG TPA: J domain-containing protein [Gemmatimonas aurantiaca]|uniref:Chaperone protein DnaJ n=2 Tax=Gemmatimonas aurantiaca TaxID=173480 RepID=C1A7F6_GEMAT|nr:J domain-containing protein [Gemmatimonas aurantiaca]BAH38166.1 chaperone protein DnaJ [Gemmatimonas aurantiaca T-27]HCT56939.1 J domain-containing protein [Gemmatimonas aurantiaca]
MANGTDYYAVLGVPSSAPADEIKKQYRRLAKQYHPDANQNDPKAADRFKEISEAYNVVGDAEKRKQYDDMRRLGAFGGVGGFNSGSARPSSRPSGFGGTGPGQGGPGTFNDFDVGGLGGLGDLFSSMFGAGARARNKGPERGQTVEQTVEIPFRVAATGGKVPVDIEVNEECAVCHGNGAAPGAQLKPCTECSGRGVISFGQGSFAVNRPCPVCVGRGSIPSERCPTCRGTGEARVRRKVLISVPSGAESGHKVRLRGQGGKGAAGGQAGDLVITFDVQSDRFYKRDGLDLIATVPINVAQATLGSRVSVRTLDGKKVAIRIPAGTSAGKRFKVSGQGIEKDGSKGDLLVEVTITVPGALNEAQEKAMRDFAEASGLKY